MGTSGWLSARGGRVLGIDIGASKIEWTYPTGGKICVWRIPVAKNWDEKKLLEIVRGLVNEYRPAAVGLSLAGFVVNGRLAALPNLPKVDGARFMNGLAGLSRAGIRFRLENDVKCMALAEWNARGQKKDDDFLLVAPGSGIGAAIVKNGRLVRGAHNTAGEAGHMKMTDERGRLVEFETLCGGFGIEKRFGKNGWDAKKIFMSKEMPAKRHAGFAARYFGLGLANLASVLDPAEIIVAGSVGRAYMQKRELHKIMQKTFEENAIAAVRKTPIRLSGQPMPALRGACLLAQGKKNGNATRFLE